MNACDLELNFLYIYDITANLSLLFYSNFPSDDSVAFLT